MIDRRAFLGTMGATAWLAGSASMFGADALGASSKSYSKRSVLRSGWKMQSSANLKLNADGPPEAASGAWYPVTLPTTVMAGLVANGEYPDLFVGDNLSRVPKSRFDVSWWYQTEFELPAANGAQQVWLYFQGINYRANIWLNGQKIAGAEQIVGSYRDFEVNVTKPIASSGTNLLMVEVLPPGKGDLTITFVDWAPKPPDQNMGLWQEVLLKTSGPLALGYPFVKTDLELPELAKARLMALVDVTNPTDQPVTGKLQGRVEEILFTLEVQLAPHSTKTVEFTPDEFSQLMLEKPRVWWPWQLGQPELYLLELILSVDDAISDQVVVNFGVRHVSSRLKDGSRLFSVNGVDMLITGGGYAPDLLQRRSLPHRPNWQEDQIRYVRDMNLNTVRLEGKLEDDAFYDLCDRYGVLVMAGWCCCSPWEDWKNWKAEQTTVAMESLRYQIRRARTHPSLLVWLNGSDNPPPEKVESQYLAIENELGWPCPTISSATDKKAASGETGVKMKGPYKWVPPIFWLTDNKTGGAWGFNTEVGPGAVPPPIESLQTMLPAEHRWPPDKFWDVHCGEGEFKNIRDFTQALDARFGKSQSLADFAWKAQAQAYETIRAMYESFRANQFAATGEIQWMLNNAWPSMIWHLYDYYLRPGGAYFATKLACEPLHVLYRYDNHAIVVANDSLQSWQDLTVSAKIYDADSKLRHKQEALCTAAPNTATTAFSLPQLDTISTTYFLHLALMDASQSVLSVNSYWLSTKPDVLDFRKSNWNITPCTSYADYTLLEKLPAVTLTVDNHFGSSESAEEGLVKAVVGNASEAIALLVRLKIVNPEDEAQELLPIRWSDNYFLLLPGEKREISARYLRSDLSWANPAVTVACFNNARI